MRQTTLLRTRLSSSSNGFLNCGVMTQWIHSEPLLNARVYKQSCQWDSNFRQTLWKTWKYSSVNSRLYECISNFDDIGMFAAQNNVEKVV